MKEITSYSIRIGSYQKDPSHPLENYTYILLMHENDVVANVRFYEPGQLPEDAISYSAGGTVNHSLPLSMFHSIVYLLKHEKPCWYMMANTMTGPHHIKFG